MSDDRPKKSWKEIDAQRDRSGSRSPRRDPDEKSRQKVESSPAYQKYKSHLDKLFTPGGQELPESMKAKLGPTTEAAKREKELLAALQARADAAALSEYLAAGFELPPDARLMIKLLDVQDQTLLGSVLHNLAQIVASGQKPSRMLLIQKLDAIALRLGSGEVAELARQIRADL